MSARLLGFASHGALAATLSVVLALAACSGATQNADIVSCSCTAVDAPVCGVDGITYENACNARCAGATVANAGHCGGGSCGCPQTSAPVCGNNGVTYENACSATCAGQTIVSSGPCSAGQDAGGDVTAQGDGGSGAGDCSSHPCGASQVCVNEGCAVFGQVCEDADDAGACPAGETHSAGGCNPSAPPPNGVCTRACLPSESTHRCVDVPSSCSPTTCSCLPADACDEGSSCGGVDSNGTLLCLYQGQPFVTN